MAARPKLQISIKERDLGFGHFLKEAAKLRKKPFVKVGVTQARGSKVHVDERSGKQVLTVADVANIHEFGVPGANIPERSFIRSTAEKNQPKYDTHIASLRDQIFNPDSGITTEKALGLIGQEVSADMKATIRAGIAPSLKESTIRSKNAAKISEAKAHLDASPGPKDFTKAGSAKNQKALDLVSTGGASTALIDTAQMINAISYEVAMQGTG